MLPHKPQPRVKAGRHVERSLAAPHGHIRCLVWVLLSKCQRMYWVSSVAKVLGICPRLRHSSFSPAYP